MNRQSFIIGILMLIPLLSASLFAAEIYTVNSESRTLSRIDSETGALNNVFTPLGLTPNLMYVDEQHIFVVCSGDNAIQMINRANGTHIRYIPVAASSNPWDVVKAGDFLYVTGLFTNKVYKISLQSYFVVNQITVGNAPEGLRVYDGKLFVANTGGYQNNYAGSSVSVIDLASFTVLETIPVWTNPQYLVAHNGFIHVSCTGNWFDVSGKVDIIDAATLQNVHRIDIGGNPGSLWIGPYAKAYLGDGMSTGLYSYDAVNYNVYNNANNPLNPSAYAVDGNDQFIALLTQTWGSNSMVKLRHHDLSHLAEYTVGLVATDMKVWGGNVSNDDPLVPVLKTSLYPNPVRQNGLLYLDSPAKTVVSVVFYNLKGQKVHEMSIPAGEKQISLSGMKLSAGVYIYRLSSGNAVQSGKIAVMK
ncbi:MAG: T9SS type A sorting domain-containing protein [Candidatus Cloacimonadaceae bacterium]|nr:T9SS type A sorting domain-containing protein [Candidatus Cloacimonadaceae bacterium]